MTICILSTGYPRWQNDFDSNYIHYLARELVNMGINVHVVAPHAPGLQKDDILDGVFIHRFQYIYPAKYQSLAYAPGIPENIKKLKNKLQIIPFLVAMFLKFRQILKKYPIDIVNAHWLVPSGVLSFYAERVYGIPVIVKLYGADLHLIKSKMTFLGKIFAGILNNSTKIISNSSYTKKLASAFLNISSNKINVLHDGVDVIRYFPRYKEKRQDQTKIILSCGRMVERKGFHYLIKAFYMVTKKHPSARLILVGDGPERPTLETEVRRLQIEKRVVFARNVSDAELFQYYKMSDIFVLPAIIDANGDTEGLGLVLLEAMASGIPVIGSDVGGIPDIISENADYGFLVPPANAEILAAKILFFLDNPEKISDFGKKGRKVVENLFSWQQIARKYVVLFKSTLEDTH